MNENFEEEMLREIDVEAIAAAFDCVVKYDNVISLTRSDKPAKPIKVTKSIPTAAASTRCKSTGKIQFKNALIAIEAFKRWKMKDPSVCWDIGRMRVYKCKKCHQFHLGKNYGTH